eukprot:365424-Chlamydomonas_euryale.AAC.11
MHPRHRGGASCSVAALSGHVAHPANVRSWTGMPKPRRVDVDVFDVFSSDGVTGNGTPHTHVKHTVLHLIHTFPRKLGCRSEAMMLPRPGRRGTRWSANPVDLALRGHTSKHSVSHVTREVCLAWQTSWCVSAHGHGLLDMPGREEEGQGGGAEGRKLDRQSLREEGEGVRSTQPACAPTLTACLHVSLRCRPL